MGKTSQKHPYDEWANIYDKVYAYLDYDLGFYTALAKQAGGSVLELGCGTGRVSLALAQEGFDVTGVDISPRMVEEAINKATNRGLSKKALFLPGDMEVPKSYGKQHFNLVIFPFRSFQSMLTVEAQCSALESAAANLDKGGLLALDVFAPEFESLGGRNDEAVPFHVRDVDQSDGGTVVVWGQNLWDSVSQINAARLIIEELDASGSMIARHYRDFDLRYTFRYELEHLLRLNDFKVESIYGDFNRGDFTEQSDDLIIVARKA